MCREDGRGEEAKKRNEQGGAGSPRSDREEPR